jgi:hypothetical protein
MTPQVPEYLVTFEAAIRPLVAAITLGLIWIGATRSWPPKSIASEVESSSSFGRTDACPGNSRCLRGSVTL